MVDAMARRLKACLVAIAWSGLLVMPVAAQSAPTNPEAVVATSSLNKLHAHQQLAMKAAIAAGLVASGEFQIVTDAIERSSAIAGFQQQIRDLGVPATFGTCDPIGLLAGTSADSNRGYGGVCEIAIGQSSERSTLSVAITWAGPRSLDPRSSDLARAKWKS